MGPIIPANFSVRPRNPKSCAILFLGLRFTNIGLVTAHTAPNAIPPKQPTIIKTGKVDTLINKKIIPIQIINKATKVLLGPNLSDTFQKIIEPIAAARAIRA